MKLADLRKLSIRKNLKIRFPLRNGLECVVTEDGVAQVPGLNRVPDFNLEEELSSISEFVVEPVSADKKRPAAPRRIGREELAAMTTASAGTGAAHEEEE